MPRRKKGLTEERVREIVREKIALAFNPPSHPHGYWEEVDDGYKPELRLSGLTRREKQRIWAEGTVPEPSSRSA